MDELSATIGEMLKAYPDPNGARPIANCTYINKESNRHRGKIV
jgi:hypothetical protein